MTRLSTLTVPLALLLGLQACGPKPPVAEEPGGPGQSRPRSPAARASTTPAPTPSSAPTATPSAPTREEAITVLGVVTAPKGFAALAGEAVGEPKPLAAAGPLPRTEVFLADARGRRIRGLPAVSTDELGAFVFRGVPKNFTFLVVARGRDAAGRELQLRTIARTSSVETTANIDLGSTFAALEVTPADVEMLGDFPLGPFSDAATILGRGAGEADLAKLTDAAARAARVKELGQSNPALAAALGTLRESLAQRTATLADVEARVERLQKELGSPPPSIGPSASATPPAPLATATPTPGPSFAPGAFEVGGEPHAIAVAPSGEVWVAEREGKRVAVLGADGTVKARHDLSQAITNARADGDGFGAIAFDPKGRAWLPLTNFSPGWIAVVGADGAFVAAYKTGGGGPRAVGFDASGNAWIANEEDVSKLSPTGELLGVYAYPAGSAAPQDLAVDAAGNAWVALASGSSTLVKFGPDGTHVGGYPAKQVVSAVAIASDGHAWAAGQETHEVVKLSAEAGFVGAYSAGKQPSDVAIAATGEVWIAAAGGKTLEKRSSAGLALGSYALPASPRRIAIDRDGNVWATLTGSGTVAKRGPNGERLSP